MTMTPLPLNRHYVGIKLSAADYTKVKGLLPLPSFSYNLHSQKGLQAVAAYVIDGYVTSPKQWKWLGDIKLGIADLLFVPFTFESDILTDEDVTVNNIAYSLQELSDAFKITYRLYPKLYYAPDKKSIYRHLLLHGKKLRHQKLFTLEAMTAAALMMNGKLKDKLSNKDLHKRVEGAYRFILENLENFPEKLSAEALGEARRRGADLTHRKRAAATEAKIFEALASGKYVKADGQVNKTMLAADLQMSRNTLKRYLNAIAV